MYVRNLLLSKCLVHQMNHLSPLSSVSIVNSQNISPYYDSSSSFLFRLFNNVDAYLLIFMISSALISLLPKNTVTIPVFVEKIAWKVCLPSSLALSIVSNESLRSYSDLSTTTNKRRSIMNSLSPSMLIAFILGLVGSVIGGYTSYLFVSHYHQQSMQNLMLPNFAAYSSCLTSSYIGGTVNFFETAEHLALSARDMDVLKQLAATDIGVMIAYFSVLNLVKSYHIGSYSHHNNSSDMIRNATNIPYDMTVSSPKMLRLSYGLLVSICSILFSIATNHIQGHFLTIPGVSIMLLTTGAASLARNVPRLLQKSRIYEHYKALLSVAKDCSTVFLGIFYLILGLLTRFQDLLALGSPICTIFVVLLSSHLIFVFLGSKLWNALVECIVTQTQDSVLKKLLGIKSRDHADLFRSRNFIDIDSLLIASNACVGGAATAASMAGSSLFNRPDLMLPASIIGIIGYLIGTPIGIKLYKLLIQSK